MWLGSYSEHWLHTEADTLPWLMRLLGSARGRSEALALLTDFLHSQHAPDEVKQLGDLRLLI